MQNSKTPCLPAGRELSIIIVNYRSEQYLKSCVASLFKYLPDITFEVIVVNNDEQEDLKDVSVQFPQIKIINHQKNIGFGAGCNLGAKSAQGEILWFLNPDTEIISNDVNKIIKKFNDNKAIGVMGGKLTDEKNNVQEWIAGKEVTLIGIMLNNLGYKRDKKIWESKKESGCAWVSGGAMFVQKELFKKLEGFDEKFFIYFEDVDFCRRVRLLGQKVLYFPEFKAVHFGGKSNENKNKQKKDFYKSQDYYFQKNFGMSKMKIIRALRRFCCKV